MDALVKAQKLIRSELAELNAALPKVAPHYVSVSTNHITVRKSVGKPLSQELMVLTDYLLSQGGVINIPQEFYELNDRFQLMTYTPGYDVEYKLANYTQGDLDITRKLVPNLSSERLVDEPNTLCCLI